MARRISDRRLDIDSLEILDRVAAVGSISGAAASLGITQQAISARIAAVERLIGGSLLHRAATGSTLTDRGRTVLELAGPVLDASRLLEAAVDALRREAATLTLAASQTLAELLLPSWLLRLRGAHPDVSVRLIAGNSTDAIESVRAGIAELGFVETPALPGDLHALALVDDELAVVVAPTHSWAQRTTITASDLADAPLLVREPGSGTRQTLQRWLSANGLELHEPAAVLATTAVVRANAVAGVAPAVMSRRTIAAELASGALVQVAVEGEPLIRQLSAIWSAAVLSPAAEALIALARSPRVAPRRPRPREGRAISSAPPRHLDPGPPRSGQYGVHD
ncbi:LysR family transcriptional regulator [Curtobacterium ammoniigenes]|uniref:LysR family transcriptional regulator n=1 Tax=Curtobacterium ammoniigenes TaxID=395387 RepID=UPI0009FA3FC7|nr:LysR family transcriptional regulator [Curtobacterium ammoniigenes]